MISFFQDGSVLPGAGACEIELAAQITSFGEKVPGLSQYAIQKFAEALEALPRAIVSNAGIKVRKLILIDGTIKYRMNNHRCWFAFFNQATNVIAQLYAVHQQGQKTFGADIEVGFDVIILHRLWFIFN